DGFDMRQIRSVAGRLAFPQDRTRTCGTSRRRDDAKRQPRTSSRRPQDVRTSMATPQHHGRKSPRRTRLPNLQISPPKGWLFIHKAREVDVKDVVTDEGSSSNAPDDGMLSVLEDHGDDPTYTELRMFINALTEDEQVDLVALTWLGRGDGEVSDWDDLR